MRDSTKALIALMEQENGVTEFQYASIVDGEWCDCSFPTAPHWKSPNIFRVKPKPIELWAWKYPSGHITSGGGAYVYEQKQSNDSITAGRTMVLLREVTK